MRIIQALFALFISLINLHSQDLNTLTKSYYDRQSQLLIQNEVRKNLGSKANSREVQKIVKFLMPWAMMEELSPQVFSKSVELLYESEQAGIPFVSNEELIPLIVSYKGSKEDFLYISRFMREAEEANLPNLYRDELIGKGLDNKWDAIAVMVAGRLLILSRQEDIETKEYYNYLVSNMNPRFSRLNPNESKDLIEKLASNFQNRKNIRSLEILNRDIAVLKKSRGVSLTENLSKTSRSLDPLFQEYGKLEIRKRPKIDPSDIGIEVIGPVEPPENQQTPIKPQIVTPTPAPAPESKPDPVQSWRILSKRSFIRVVKGWLGTKYKWGGNTKRGVDCSGFVLQVYTDSKVGVPRSKVPRVARAQAKIGSYVARNKTRKGDMVFFSASPNSKKITHVGLVMENSQFAHASSSRGVIIQPLSNRYWAPRYVTSRRIFSGLRD